MNPSITGKVPATAASSGAARRAPNVMLGAFRSVCTMHLIGIPLRKPSHNELAASTVMAVGLWLAGLGLMQAAQAGLGRAEAGALLLVCLWGCLSARVGIRIDRGGRHLLAAWRSTRCCSAPTRCCASSSPESPRVR